VSVDKTDTLWLYTPKPQTYKKMPPMAIGLTHCLAHRHAVDTDRTANELVAFFIDGSMSPPAPTPVPSLPTRVSTQP